MKIRAADLFCGAGGTSTGLSRACKALGVDLELVAVNHWPVAIETHSKNHTTALHLCTGLDGVDPRKVCPDGLDLLLASPECTHHSNARGGKPVSDQSRASAWHVVRWAEALRPKAIVVENVPEFRTWGPTKRMKKDGVVGDWPDPKRRGETYQAFLAALRSLGYEVDDKVLVAADYGDPTTRKRLFVMARLGRRRPEFPAQTHAKATDQVALFGGLKPWVPARDIIDWALPGESIFERKKPLADSTMRRIAAGLKKFSGGKFILPQQRFDNTDARSVDKPLHTITAHGGRVTGLVDAALVKVDPDGLETHRRVLGEALRADGFAEPFIMSAGGPKVDPRSVADPVNTVLTRDHMGVVTPMIVQFKGTAQRQLDGTAKPVDVTLGTVTGSGADFGLVEPRAVMVDTNGIDNPNEDGSRTKSSENPVPTVTGSNRIGVTQAFLVPGYGEREGQEPRTHSVDSPVPTVPATGGGKFGLVEPFLLSQASGGSARPVSEPVPTVVGKGAVQKVDPYIIPLNGGDRREVGHSIDDPMKTVTTIDAWALIEPFILQYYGSSEQAKSTTEPLPTVTTKDRFLLVRPTVEVAGQQYALDIRFRMLTPKELARAMSFGDDYQFAGNREAQVKQIGNAVPCELSKALCVAALKPIVGARAKKEALLLEIEGTQGQALA